MPPLLPATATPAQDAIGAAVGGLTAGAEGSAIDPATGAPVRLRLVRSYYAASGRPCRQYDLGDGGARVRVACQYPGGWAQVPPLVDGVRN